MTKIPHTGDSLIFITYLLQKPLKTDLFLPPIIENNSIAEQWIKIFCMALETRRIN